LQQPVLKVFVGINVIGWKILMPWQDWETKDLLAYFTYTEVTTDAGKPTCEFRTKKCDEGRTELIGILLERARNGEDMGCAIQTLREIAQKDSVPTIRESARDALKWAEKEGPKSTPKRSQTPQERHATTSPRVRYG
jgi:hypothetical protein